MVGPKQTSTVLRLEEKTQICLSHPYRRSVSKAGLVIPSCWAGQEEKGHSGQSGEAEVVGGSASEAGEGILKELHLEI